MSGEKVGVRGNGEAATTKGGAEPSPLAELQASMTHTKKVEATRRQGFRRRRRSLSGEPRSVWSSSHGFMCICQLSDAQRRGVIVLCPAGVDRDHPPMTFSCSVVP